jgi:hypothetical protein
MPFHADDYVGGDEADEVFDITINGCTWFGYLCRRKSGGFDLFYDHQASAFPKLSIDKITRLRLFSEACHGFIVHLPDTDNRKELVAAAKEHLRAWLVPHL